MFEKHVLKPALKKLYQYFRGWTICVETHELCILPDPNSYYENPDRYIRMKPVSICTVPVDKMRSLFMYVVNQMIFTDYALLVLNYFIW